MTDPTRALRLLISVWFCWSSQSTLFQLVFEVIMFNIRIPGGKNYITHDSTENSPPIRELHQIDAYAHTSYVSITDFVNILNKILF